jgi:cytochrome P450
MGPIFRSRRGAEEYTVLAGPEANLFIAQNGAKLLRADRYRRDQDLEFGVGRSLVSMNGDEHARMRRLQKRGYSRAALDDKYPELIEVVRRSVRNWKVNKPVLVRDALPPIVAEELGVGVLGYPLGDYFDDVTMFVRTVVIETVAKVRPRTVLDSPEYRSAKTRSLRLADRVIAAHRKTLVGRRSDLVDDLLAAIAEDPALMTKQELRIAVLGGYIGGLDTVAYTCAFMLYSLLKHSDVLTRITAEVDGAFGDGFLKPGDLRNMRVMRYATLETLRLYPLSGAIQATAARAFEFAGHRVDEGANVIVATTVPHFMESLYPQPFVFDVDRHAGHRHEHQNPGAFAPFGIGPHICLGAGMAEVLIMLTMAALLHTARFALHPPNYTVRIGMIPVPVPFDFHVMVTEHR